MIELHVDVFRSILNDVKGKHKGWVDMTLADHIDTENSEDEERRCQQKIQRQMTCAS